MIKATIDSAKLSLPYNRVTILNELLLANRVRVVVDKDTGEQLEREDMKSNSLKHQFEGFQTHFVISTNANTKEQFVVILINSRLLGRDYFEGITAQNIRQVYDKIISAKVIDVSFEDFLEYGVLSDTDIKRDVILRDKVDFLKVFRRMHSSTLPTNRLNEGSRVEGGQKQKSIYFNARPSATISKPFGKIYCKELEVEHNKKNKLFYEANGLISESIGRLRTEFTLKNNTHFKHHNFSNRLGKFLETSQEDLNKFLTYCIEANIHPRLPQPSVRRISVLKPRDLVVINLMSFIFKVSSVTPKQIFGVALQGIESSSQKSQTKKWLSNLYDSQIAGEDFQKQSEDEANLSGLLGWY